MKSKLKTLLSNIKTIIKHGKYVAEECPIHVWFELSYAQYLTIPRSVLQAMPHEWKKRFVKCLEELDNTIDWRPEEGRYWVCLKDAKGRYKHDTLMQYRHSKLSDIPFRPGLIIKDSNGFTYNTDDLKNET